MICPLKLKYILFSRSNKVEEVLHCPWAEIAWYFPETREQYRFLGRITIVSKDEEDEKLAKARTSAWKNMSDPGRQQFTWPTPGIPRLEENGEASQPPMALGKDDPVADPFCLCFMDVSAVDHLELKSNVRRKFSFDGDSNTWLQTEVNP